MSLKLDGLERMTMIRARGVVMHAADYVSNSFIRNNNRLGRVKAVLLFPLSCLKRLLRNKDKSCFFIYHPSEYLNLEQSQFLNLKK
jgi:hypothetical protein